MYSKPCHKLKLQVLGAFVGLTHPLHRLTSAIRETRKLVSMTNQRDLLFTTVELLNLITIMQTCRVFAATALLGLV